MNRRISIHVSLALTMGLVLTVALLWSLSGSPLEVQAQGIIRYVAPGGSDVGDCNSAPCATVQYAVDQASDGDEVHVAGGLYQGVTSREGLTQAVYIEKSLVIRGGYDDTAWSADPDPVANPTTLDAQGEGRVIYVAGLDEAINLTIEGLCITGGSDAKAGSDYGGGVYIRIRDDTVVFRNNEVFSNAAEYGGGMYLYELQEENITLLESNDFFSNTATNRGGGIYLNKSQTTFDGNRIISNTVSNGDGGGLYLNESNQASLNHDLVDSNDASNKGGGLHIYNSAATLNGITITHNSAVDGGGLYLLRSGAAILDGNRIISNTASDDGGGMFIDQSDLTLTNNVIADNQAGAEGSGIYIERSAPRLLHSTIARNSGGEGSGVHVTKFSLDYSSVVLTNTILVSHAVGISVTSGNQAALDGTLWGTGAWANDRDWGGEGQISTGTLSYNYWEAPAFLNPDAGNYHIAGTSSAREAGLAVDVSTDMDGQARPSDWAFDIGADEYGTALLMQKVPQPRYLYAGQTVTYTLVITSAGAVEATGVWFTDTLPLKQQATGADTSHGSCSYGTGWGDDTTCDLGTIAPDTVVYITITAQMTDLEPLQQGTWWKMRNDAWVKASETPSTTARANTLWAYCLAQLNDGTPFTGSGVIQQAVDAGTLVTDVIKVSGYCADLTSREGTEQTVYLSKTLNIQGGWNFDFTVQNVANYPTTLDARGEGRAFYITTPAARAGRPITPTIEKLYITNGDAAGLGGGGFDADAGGGVYVLEADPIFDSNEVSTNTADYGGGIYLSESDATLTLNTIAGNTARKRGGGVYLDWSDATLDDNVIESNTAVNLGGGVSMYQSDATFSDNDIIGNTAEDGGGLYLQYCDATLAGNTVQSNIVTGQGAGMHLLSSDAILNDNQILENATNGDSFDSQGGGIYLNKSDATLNRNVISHNAANKGGGGAYLNNGRAELNRNIVTQNTQNAAFGTGSGGGGIYLFNTNDKLDGNQIISNTAQDGDGGGLFIYGQSPQLLNNVIADNQASDTGSGAYIDGASLDFFHTTIARNRGGGSDGRGIYLVNNGEVNLNLVNTIIASQTTGIYIGAQNTVTLRSTLWYSNDDNVIDNGNLISTTSFSGDPGFENPDGGNYHLRETVLTAIDKGEDVGATTDMDGDPRPAGRGFEIGADERGTALIPYKAAGSRYLAPGETLNYTLIVTAAGTDPASNVQMTDTLPALQEFVQVSSDPSGICTAVTGWGGGVICNVSGMNVGDTVRVTLTARVTDTIPNYDEYHMRNTFQVESVETLVKRAYADTVRVYCRARINDDAIYEGSSAVQQAVDASDSSSDVIKVAGYCADAAFRDGTVQTVYLENTGLTIQGGWNYDFSRRDPSQYLTTLDGRGEGRTLYITGLEAFKPTVEGLHITGGDATGLGGGPNEADAGGGVYVTGASPNLNGNWIFGNVAELGGGLYLEGGNPKLTNNVIADNQADDAGRGVYVMSASPQLLHTTIAQKNNDESGAGVYITDDGGDPSVVAFNNTILVSHTLGISVADGNQANLESTLFYGNAQNWSGSGVSSNNEQVGDPTFVDASAGDYHIKLGSAAIDWGADVGVTTDVDGQPRPQGFGAAYDLGADETGLYVSKGESRDPIKTGAPLTFTVYVTNTGSQAQTVTITDVLPSDVTPTGEEVWTSVTIGAGETWTDTVVVTVDDGFLGSLTNVVKATSIEGGADIYTETTTVLSNLPPDMPSDPIPLDDAIGIPLDQILSWQCSDYDGDPVTYTIALEDNYPPSTVAEGLTSPSYDPGTLSPHTNYFWRVTASDGISETTGPVWQFETVNQPPDAPSSPNPAHNAAGVTLTPTLTWQGNDPDGDTLYYHVAFGSSSPPPLQAFGLTDTSYDPGVLSPHTDYYWFITVTDGISTTVGPAWQFTTRNLAPDVPGNPDPADGAIGVPLTQTLGWQSGDGDGDAVTYDVAFGTSDPPPVVAQDLTDASYTPALVVDTTYYWRITASDGISETAGPTWSFFTGQEAPNQPPYTPSVPDPADGATGVPTNQIFGWQGGDPDPGDTVTYDVAMGTSDPPPLVAQDLTSASYIHGPLITNTTYYWRVTASDGALETTGALWSFTTAFTETNWAPLLSDPDPAHGATGVPITPTLRWQGIDYDGDPVTYSLAFGTSSPPPVVEQAFTTTSYNPGVLDTDTTYYWRITASDGISVTQGPIWHFATTAILPPPAVPNLLSPADGATVTQPNVTFRWEAGVGATPTGYNLDVDGEVLTTTGTSWSTNLSTDLHNWRVRAYNTAGHSPWSDTWTVEVGSTYIYLPLVLNGR